jgi:hypothetical protein
MLVARQLSCGFHLPEMPILQAAVASSQERRQQEGGPLFPTAAAEEKFVHMIRPWEGGADRSQGLHPGIASSSIDKHAHNGDVSPPTEACLLWLFSLKQTREKKRPQDDAKTAILAGSPQQ